MRRVMIVKTGRFETFRLSQARSPSLGDVLRSTVVLHAFKEDHVSWITSAEAVPLLNGNPFISELLAENGAGIIPGDLPDVLVNLENDPQWTSWAESAPIDTKLGYLGRRNSERHPPRGSAWQEALYELIGKRWTGEEYSLPSRYSRSSSVGGIGLNWAVGPKWPSKIWPQSRWEELGALLSAHFPVSWQRGFEDLNEYIDWVSSCSSLITVDSLGLHLAIALKKPVLALFGPTPAWEIPLYGRGIAVYPGNPRFHCSPCLNATCTQEISCMDELSAKDVYDAFVHLRREHELD